MLVLLSSNEIKKNIFLIIFIEWKPLKKKSHIYKELLRTNFCIHIYIFNCDVNKINKNFNQNMYKFNLILIFFNWNLNE